jgi:hypothetical protein
MFVGVSIGVTPFAQGGGAVIALNYEARVIADGGTCEGIDCVIFELNDLNSEE